MKKLLYIIFLILAVGNAQNKAFPDAYGAGAEITGGRGGTVLHVTNLSNNNSPGSLRWALSQQYPRIIVFDVSGTINLGGTNQWLNGAGYGNVTIAGQTAPEGGITITNGLFTIQEASNIIVRYIKFRGGYYQDQRDSFRLFQCSNVIIDHCDFWYGRDEGLDVSDKTDASDGTVTVQNSLFAENKTALILGIAENDAGNPAYQPVSVLKNLFINNSHRFPKYAGEGRVDVINNGVGNWAWRMMRFDGFAFDLNEINNYYQPGTNSTTNTNTADGLNKVSTTVSTYDIYTNGNYLTPSHATAMGISNYNSDNTLGWSNYTTASAVSSSVFVGTPFTQNGVSFTPLTAANVKQHVIDNAGARHYLNADGSIGEYLDNLQSTYIGYFENGNAPSLLDYDTEYGTQATGVPNNTRPAGYDTDNDGMPNTWETANGLNPNVADDDGNDLHATYTNIEMFINEVDDPPTNVPVTGVSWDADTTSIPTGQSVSTTWTVSPANASNQTVSFSSSNTSVLNDAGTALSAGTATYTITTSDGSFTDDLTVTVTDAPTQPEQNITKKNKKNLLIKIIN